MGIASLQHGGKPAIGRDPVHRLAGGEIKDMRPTTKSVDARFRAAICVLETPQSTQAKFGSAAFDELDDMLRIAGDVIAHPELRTAMLWLDGEQEAIGGRILNGIVIRQSFVEIQRAGSVFGGAYIEQARKVREIIGHDSLLA
ncbi:hypothetical protein AZF01_18585 [Martelella sp. AD-3]|nr:hypothetical protein AZF01_18585 [Martelella sp. AD-3]